MSTPHREVSRVVEKGLTKGRHEGESSPDNLSLDNINPCIQQPEGARVYVKDRICIISWNINGISFDSVTTKEKLEILRNLVDESKSEIVLLQETHLRREDMKWFNAQFNNFLWFHSFGVGRSKGVAIGVRIAALNGSRIHVHCRDKVGRYIYIAAQVNNIECDILSIYVPSFIKNETLEEINRKCAPSENTLIFGGDFNINFVKEEFTLLEKWLDVRNCCILDNEVFTYRDKSIIDYIGTSSSCVLNDRNLDVVVGSGLDHSILVATLRRGDDGAIFPIKPKINPSLCESSVVHKEAIARIGPFKVSSNPMTYINQFSDAVRDIILNNDKVIKNPDIRNSLMKVVACKEVNDPSKLASSIREDEFVKTMCHDYYKYSSNSNKARRRKWRAIIRYTIINIRKNYGCKVSHLLGKKCPKLTRLKSNFKFSIVDANNRMIERCEDVETMVGEFWKGVFSSVRKFDHVKLNNLLKNSPSLQLCNAKIYKVDRLRLRKIVTKKCSSSSGLDELPFCLFASSFDVLEEVWIRLIEGIANGEIVVSEEFGNSLLILIPKGGKNMGVSSFRPICITSTIYRIIMKVFASEMRNAIHPLIATNQRALLKGRTIGSAVGNIINTFYGRISQRLPTIFLQTDFKKAFDFINRDAIRIILERSNIPKHLQRVVRICLNTNSTQWNTQHIPTVIFPSVSGVRQGCPLSPLIYILVVDLLVRNLSEVEGVVTLGSYADDNGLILSNTECLSVIRRRIRDYELAVGAELNLEKCSIISNLKIGYIKSWNGLKICKSSTYLGIKLGLNISADDMWGDAVIKAATVSTRIKKLRISFSEKVRLVNTYLVPLFSYISQFYLMPSKIAGRIWLFIRRCLGLKGGIGNRGLAARMGPLNLVPAIRDPYIANVASLLSSFPSKMKHTHPLSTINQRILALEVMKRNMRHIPNREFIMENYSNFELFGKYRGIVKRRITGITYDMIINCDSPILPTKLLSELDANRELNAIYIMRNASFKGKSLRWNNYIQLLHKCWDTKSKLSDIGIGVDVKCTFCGADSQSHQHLIGKCIVTEWIYAQSKYNDLLPKNPVDLLLADKLLCRKEVEVRLRIINALKYSISTFKDKDDVIRHIEKEISLVKDEWAGGGVLKDQSITDDELRVPIYEYRLRFDGSANPKLLNGGFGYAIFKGDMEIACGCGPIGLANVNIAEVCALEKGLSHALSLGISELSVIGDSKFAVNLGTIRNPCTNPRYMVPYCNIQKMISEFARYEIFFLPRRFNFRADVLAFTGCNAPNLCLDAMKDLEYERPLNVVTSAHRFCVKIPNRECQRYFCVKNPLD
jgi:exonuclease III/ribonuclease HI